MTENKRIFLNVIATYGRSLYGLALGLLCGRWALMALGVVDYGLIGLVGGLTAFIAFFNSVLAGANARFYAFSVGAAKAATDKQAALEECRIWFNTALSVHTAVPFVLIAIGYPVGVYAIEHWLTIPPDRIATCVWVFRFVCLSCFVGMVNVPFSAMYGAKQYIAELTIYSFITSTLNVFVLYYMIKHPSDWLLEYSAWTCLLAVVPQLIISIRAYFIFPECRINFKYMWKKDRLRKLGYFTGWQMLGVFCGMLRGQGIAIVINKFFGAAMNAAQAIGNSVQGHCNTLAGAMQGAFVPVITQACGAGDYDKMNRFVIRTCKFNVVLTAIFAVPLAIELPEVMRLWLKNPPDFATGLCYCAMLLHLASCCTTGHVVAINASGKIVAYHVVMSAVSILTVPLAVVFGYYWRNVFVVMALVLSMELINSAGRVYFARKLVGTSIRKWMFEVMIPSVVTILLCGIIGIIPHLFMLPSFIRVCMTTVFFEVVYLPLIWFVVLSKDERQFVIEKFGPRIKRIFGR